MIYRPSRGTLVRKITFVMNGRPSLARAHIVEGYVDGATVILADGERIAGHKIEIAPDGLPVCRRCLAALGEGLGS